MSDAPDPLGKRALFWAPAQRHEDGPRSGEEREVGGKHALFSDSGRAAPATGGRARPRSTAADPGPPESGDRPRRARAGHPSRSLGPDDHPADSHAVEDWRSPPVDQERPAGAGMFGALTLHCSSCRMRSQVDLLEFVALHLPLWLWRPGRGYTQFMTCPACRRRTWISASWTSWSR